MIVINGKEAGGQILRTAVALSTLTLKPIKVTNIRETRPRPGLFPQHMAGIKTAAEFCNADVKGLQFGSTEIEFIPKNFKITNKIIDTGTSASISLLLQTLTPMLIFSDKKVTLEIIGGTAGLGSPTIEFVENVTFPILSKFGVSLPKIEILKQGFYPRGGGRVRITFYPTKLLTHVNLTNQGKLLEIRGISIAGSLPESVALRQAEAAKQALTKVGENIRIEHYSVPTYSQGTSITVWAKTENSILGADNLGRRGVRAEEIGRGVARDLINSIESKAALDKFMADQILVFLALAHGKSSITVEEITQHCISNISVCEKILGCRFSVEKTNRRIEVEGIGFTR